MQTLTAKQSLVPRLVAGKSKALELAFFIGGVVLLSVLAQVSIALPYTPVPITGQTFGVMLVALLWGRNRGSGVIAAYIAIGALGAPVFANARSGLILGPTMGYLLAMPLAGLVVGTLSDRGFARNFVGAYLSCVCGSLIIFTCGLLVLRQFIPGDWNVVFAAGLWPFLAGDLIKSVLAATIATRAQPRR